MMPFVWGGTFMRLLKLGGWWVLPVFFMGVAIPAGAQTVTATLQGQVFDPGGGAIPKAKVAAVNEATGFSRSAETSDSGETNLPAMPGGNYTVTAEAAGFKTEAQKVTL